MPMVILHALDDGIVPYELGRKVVYLARCCCMFQYEASIRCLVCLFFYTLRLFCLHVVHFYTYVL